MEQTLEFKITRMFRLEGNSNVKAFVDLALNESLLLKGIRIVDGKKGLFVSMPREKGKDGRWYDVVHLMSPMVKDQVNSLVLSAYSNA